MMMTVSDTIVVGHHCMIFVAIVRLVITFLCFISCSASSSSSSIIKKQHPIATIDVTRFDDTKRKMQERLDESVGEKSVDSNWSTQYYFSSTIASDNRDTRRMSGILGEVDYAVTAHNPLKGFAINPHVVSDPYRRVPHTLEAFYVGLDTVLRGPKQYDWTTFEQQLNETAVERKSHAIPRFYIHYPGEPIRLPTYLVDTVEFRPYDAPNGRSGVTPNYNDPFLLQAIHDFIMEFGAKYDGDVRLGYIQMGILGFWGEWHVSNDDTLQTLLSNETKSLVMQWFDDAFDITPYQTRYPHPLVLETKAGFYDDSFAYATLDGIYNGGVIKPFFFWPQVVQANQTLFWHNGPMGGEGRSKIMNQIFHPDYPANDREHHQDFMDCMYITHLTYLKMAWFFSTDVMDEEAYQIQNAFNASTRMGYNFYVAKVAATSLWTSSSIDTSDPVITLEVTVVQAGIAPFYYPLSLQLYCASLPFPVQISGVNEIMDQGDYKTFAFQYIPALLECLNDIQLSLVSSAVDTTIQNPIKFAQKINSSTERKMSMNCSNDDCNHDDDGIIHLQVPLPKYSQDIVNVTEHFNGVDPQSLVGELTSHNNVTDDTTLTSSASFMTQKLSTYYQKLSFILLSNTVALTILYFIP